MEILDQNELRQYYDALFQAGQRLIEAAEVLLRRLKDLRRFLSLDQDVPYAVASPVGAAL
jgi:hypothetical protein